MTKKKGNSNNHSPSELARGVSRIVIIGMIPRWRSSIPFHLWWGWRWRGTPGSCISGFNFFLCSLYSRFILRAIRIRITLGSILPPCVHRIFFTKTLVFGQWGLTKICCFWTRHGWCPFWLFSRISVRRSRFWWIWTRLWWRMCGLRSEKFRYLH